MKVTIIYDNTAFRGDLKSNWGFAALVEAHSRRILFDTGTRGALLLSNIRSLGIDPQEIDDIFISHAHFDHTGGLPAFLKQNREVTVWSPPSFRGAKRASKVIQVPQPRTLYDGIHSTGELQSIEQSLCVETQLGIIIVAGCSHPDMAAILSAASQFGKVYGIIGGLHGTRPESLEGLQLICATHCTRHKKAIQRLYPDAYVEGGAGRILEIGAAVTAE
ncbi:MAG: MBL fold metallo-hydrolase [Spirochaetaceae bacterium]|nr:MBL fold metallo-hydrolase [Spirochaetaceae bacterium]MCF7947616.1 MBL fold metallo-hydrolase [Spirochaetia bacterium]MCF7952029.1 MBL fold metallo-hydrolase [Spirochaetaceae bacterium]